MKVSIITLHRITNFGSLLQTYATQKYIQSLGYDTEVVDFVPDGITFKRGVWPKGASLLSKAIKFAPLLFCNTLQFSMVDKYLKEHIKTTPVRYNNYKELSENPPVADIYLSGSDQVWNTQNNNPEDDLKAYYLCFVPENKRKIAYAGSFGKEDFSDEEKAKIGNWLKSYDYISVREDAALKTLDSLGVSGEWVTDPTLLLTQDDWRDFCKKKKPEPGYVFVYNLNRNKLLEEAAVRIAAEKGLRVVNFADTFEFVKGAENRFNNDAFDFLNYISNADFVVTDSFHGTAFSLNFNRQFVCVSAPKYNCRLESILRLTGLLDNRLVFDVDGALDAAKTEIDYSVVAPKLEEERKKSRDFLKNALEGKPI